MDGLPVRVSVPLVPNAFEGSGILRKKQHIVQALDTEKIEKIMTNERQDTKEGEMTKKACFCLVMVLAGMFGLALLADAATIKNKTKQRLAVSLSGGRTINVAAGATANVTDADLSSPNVQNLIRAGKLELVTPSSGKGKRSSKPAPPGSPGKYR